MTHTFLMLLAFADPSAPAADVAAGSLVEVDSVLLTLVEQRDVSAEEAGVLRDLSVVEGRLVKPGQPLAKVDQTDAVIAARRAEVELEIARAQAEDETTVGIAEKSLELAEEELARTERTLAKVERAVSAADLQRDRLRRDVAQLELEKSRRELAREDLNARMKAIELEAAERAVERRRITAPIGGMVVQVNRRDGEWVEPGEPVLRILRIDRLRAEALLDASVATAELVGRPVVVTASVPNRTNAEFSGRVVFVSPEINPVGGTARVWVDVENPKLELRPGQHVRMTIRADGDAETAKDEPATTTRTAERK